MAADARKARNIFLEAVENHPPEEWDVFLDQACQENLDLRERVAVLLRAHAEANSLLDQPGRVLLATVDEPIGERPGTTIGPYKLLEEIGEGGMGSVWMAEQRQPVQRKVALKIIKPGMDSRQVVARFEAERQALALMDHPNIATVFDGGTTASGRPYFVMELVKGTPITRYCDEHRLTPRQRLDLFLPVCQAIQHAHTKGIIHRDIKPANLLVAPYDGRPVPKVIDFGVAKATGQRLTERTLFTAFGAVVGTLEYMSPEQAELNNQDIDTRSDIYSLGVLLYELLTGTTPLGHERVTQVGFAETLRLIREEDPQRPSTRLSASREKLAAIAAQRHMEPAKLTKALRGELDWIVMKALEKDRNRRYETASAFAADIQRLLDDEPVQACPPSVVYRLRKFARRNRRWVLAAALLLVLLAAAVVGLAWTNLVVSREKKRGDEEARTAKAVNDFLQDLLGQADIGRQPWRPERRLGRNPTITVRELLDRAAQEIEAKFTDQPLTEAAIRLTIGDAYRALGRFQQAHQHLKRSVELRTQNLGTSHPDTLASKHGLAVVCREQCRFVEATPLFLEVLEARTAKLGADHTDTLNTKNELAELYLNLGKRELATQLAQQVLEARLAKLGPVNLETLQSKNKLADLYVDQGQFDKAERLYLEVLEAREARLGADHRDTLNTRSDLIWVYLGQSRYAEAEEVAREVVEVRMAKWGDDHPDTLGSKHDLAFVYQQRGEYRKAEPLYLETLRTSIAKFGPNHLLTLRFTNSLGMLYEYQAEYSKAEQMFQQELQAGLSAFGPDHPHTLFAKNNLASLHDDQGRYSQAERGYQEAVDGLTTIFGPAYAETLIARTNLAILYTRWARYAEAERLFLEILRTQNANLGPNHPDVQTTKHYLAWLYQELGRFAEAEAMFQEVLSVRQAALDADHPLILTTRNSLAEVYLARGRYAEAAPLLQGVLKARVTKLGADHPDTLTTMHNLASLDFAQGNFAPAEALFLEVLKSRQVKLAAGHPETLTTKTSLAELYLTQRQHAKAEPLALDAVKGRTTNLGANHPRTLAGMEQLVRLYDSWGKKDTANEWRKKLEETKTGVKSPPKP